MPGWRTFRKFVRDVHDLVRDDWLFMWFLGPVTVTVLALILWVSWLSDVVQAIAGSNRWAMLTNTPQGLAILAGFATLTIGHMINAWLTRRRDDRLREEEALALAAALQADMLAAITVVGHMREVVDAHFDSDNETLLVSDYEIAKKIWAVETPVYRANLSRLGILGAKVDSLAVTGFRLVAKQTQIILHNLYVAGARDGDGEKVISDIYKNLAIFRIAAEELRQRAGRPPDKNTEIVTSLYEISDDLSIEAAQPDMLASSQESPHSIMTNDPGNND